MRAQLRLWRACLEALECRIDNVRLQRGSLALLAPSTSKFETDAVIDSPIDPLLAAKVSLSCLDRHVTKQELDLF